MEPDELKRYMAMKDRCTDIASEMISVRQKLEASFNRVPIFQVHFEGLCMQLRQLDAKLDNGAALTEKEYLMKIYSTIQGFTKRFQAMIINLQ